MKKMPYTLALLAGMGLSSAVFADGLTKANIGETIGVTCFGCHGYNGVSKGAAPSLKGHPGVAQAMKDFKSGKRPASIMGRIAKGYSDADIDAVGKFFANMK